MNNLSKAYLGMLVVNSAMTVLVKQVVNENLHHEENFVVVYDQATTMGGPYSNCELKVLLSYVFKKGYDTYVRKSYGRCLRKSYGRCLREFGGF